jgi:hypothetical protein
MLHVLLDVLRSHVHWIDLHGLSTCTVTAAAAVSEVAAATAVVF